MTQITAVFKGEKFSDVAQIFDEKNAAKLDNPEEDLLQDHPLSSGDVSKA